MGRVQMSTEEKTGRRARDRKKKNWREESFETTKSHSRPAVSRMSASILLLAGLLFMVTGCSPAAPPGSVSRQDPEVKIRVVCSSGDIRWKSGMENAAEAFMKSNQDIKVELYFMPEAENQTYARRLEVLAAQGEFNDIVELRETDSLVQAGLLAPMPEEVYSLVENPGTCGGICYGVPLYTTTLGMIYNAEIFERLGLCAPRTYEEFLRVCATLKASGYDAIALGAAGDRHMKYWGNYLFCNYIASGDGQACWTKEKAAEMLGDFRDLASRGYINSRYRAVTDRETARAISTRQAVMVYAGPQMLQQIENLNPQIRLGFFFLPGKNGTVYAMDDRSVQWGISSLTAGDGKKMDACARFLQFCYSEGVYETILEIMNGNSVTVRRVNMPDTPDRRIMEAAYEGKPVHTELLLKEAQPTDGFIAFYDQMLVGPFKGHSFYIMDDNGECIYSVDSAGTGKAADSMASLIPSMNQGTGSLLKDGNYVVYERPEPYGWTVAAKVPQDQVLNMGSTVRYTAVFLGAVFLALLCLYCHNYISLHLYKDAV